MRIKIKIDQLLKGVMFMEPSCPIVVTVDLDHLSGGDWQSHPLQHELLQDARPQLQSPAHPPPEQLQFQPLHHRAHPQPFELKAQLQIQQYRAQPHYSQNEDTGDEVMLIDSYFSGTDESDYFHEASIIQTPTYQISAYCDQAELESWKWELHKQ